MSGVEFARVFEFIKGMQLKKFALAGAATLSNVTCIAQGFDPTLTHYYRVGNDAVFFSSRRCMISFPAQRGMNHVEARVKNYIAMGCYLVTDGGNLIVFWQTDQTQWLNRAALRPIAEYRRNPLPALDATIDYPRPQSLTPGSGKGYVIKEAPSPEVLFKAGLPR